MTETRNARRSSATRSSDAILVCRVSQQAAVLLTQKREIGGRMTYELDEGLPHGLPYDGMGSDDVSDGEERKQDPYPDYLERLQDHVFPAESGQSLVPYRSEELLHVGMRHELKRKFRFLAKIDTLHHGKT